MRSLSLSLLLLPFLPPPASPRELTPTPPAPADALHLTHLSHLILDASHLDSKKRSLVDLPEARADLFKLLGTKAVMDRLREGKMKIVVF